VDPHDGSLLDSSNTPDSTFYEITIATGGRAEAVSVGFQMPWCVLFQQHKVASSVAGAVTLNSQQPAAVAAAVTATVACRSTKQQQARVAAALSSRWSPRGRGGGILACWR